MLAGNGPDRSEARVSGPRKPAGNFRGGFGPPGLAGIDPPQPKRGAGVPGRGRVGSRRGADPRGGAALPVLLVGGVGGGSPHVGASWGRGGARRRRAACHLRRLRRPMSER